MFKDPPIRVVHFSDSFDARLATFAPSNRATA